MPRLPAIRGGVDVDVRAGDLVTFEKDGIEKSMYVVETEDRNDFGYLRAWGKLYER